MAQWELMLALIHLEMMRQLLKIVAALQLVACLVVSLAVHG